MRDLVIIGAGTGCEDVLWVFREVNDARPAGERWNLVGLLDDRADLHGSSIGGVHVMGSVDDFLAGHPKRIAFHCTIGSNRDRARIVQDFENAGHRPVRLVFPGVVMAPDAEVGEGSFIAAGAVLAARAKVGRHAIINVGCCMGHHSEARDYSQCCPGSVMNGYCTLGKYGFLGSNAALHPGVKVGDHATVGSCSYAIEDVPAYTTVVGNPAKAVYRVPKSRR